MKNSEKLLIGLYFKDRAGLLPGILPTDPCDGDLTDPELDEVRWSTTNGTCTTCDITNAMFFVEHWHTLFI